MSRISYRSFVITLTTFAFAAIAVSGYWGGVTVFGVANAANQGHRTAPPPTATPTATPRVYVPGISSFDAALVARHAEGISPQPTDNHKCAADVSGNGIVTTIDSGLINNYVLDNPYPYNNVGDTGTTFAPGPCSNNSPPFPFPNTTTIVRGDVSGTEPAITQPVQGNVGVSLPSVTATPGTILVPITVGDTTGLSIWSYDFQVDFDPAVVQPASPAFCIDPFGGGACVNSSTTLSNYWSVGPNVNNPGHMIISGFYSADLTGSGTLINLVFNVVGTAGQSTALTFASYTDPNSFVHQKFVFNDSDQSVTNGSITVGSSISGTVTYGNAIGAPNPRYVSNVLISGAGSPAVSTTTAAPGVGAGTYGLSGFGAGSYTVTPSKTGGANNAITSFDAAKIAAHVAGNSPLVGNQLVAADVSNNGTISSFDSGLIANYVVSHGNTVTTGTWKFFTVPNVPLPVGSTPRNRTYPSVTSNLTGEDYTGILMGEVSGNWNPAINPRPANGPERPMAVNLPRLVTPADNEVLIPVSIRGAANKGIISYEFDLRYDPSVIKPQANPVDVTGTVSRGLAAVANPDEPGLLRVVVYGPMPISSDGVLLNLRFAAVGKFGSVSSLTWERIMFNEGDPRASATDGQVGISFAVSD